MLGISSRVLVGFGFGASISLAGPTLGDFPPNYNFIDIVVVPPFCWDTTDAVVGVAYGINDLGRNVVGQANNICVGTNPARAFKRFLNSPAAIVDLGALGGCLSRAWAVRNNGSAVGFAYTFGPVGVEWPRPVIFQPVGSNINLPTVGGFQSDEGEAFDLDNNARIVGESEISPGVFRASYWFESGPDLWEVVINLGTLPNGSESSARGKNNNNDIVGWSFDAGGIRRAVIWEPIVPDTTWLISELPTLGGDSFAYDINDSKVIVGWSETAGEQHAVSWEFVNSQWEITVLATLGGNKSEAHAVNTGGDIVGMSRTGSVGTDRAALWTTDGVVHDLNVRRCRYVNLDLSENWAIEWAWDINDAGDIAGYGHRDVAPPIQRQRPFLMRPIICEGDVNGDGVTDIVDFLQLLADWFGGCGPSDIDNDDTVGIVDFLALLADWDCPNFNEPFPASAQECIDRYYPEFDKIEACIIALGLSGEE